MIGNDSGVVVKRDDAGCDAPTGNEDGCDNGVIMEPPFVRVPVLSKQKQSIFPQMAIRLGFTQLMPIFLRRPVEEISPILKDVGA